MELSKDIYVVGIWYVAWEGADWLASITRRSPEDPLTLEYRFRYYSAESTSPFDMHDKKNWYQGHVNDDREDDVISKINLVAEKLARCQEATVNDAIIVKGDGLAALHELEAKPWAHMRKVDFANRS